ncbi:MAG: metalloregulator ArsR/SmtB family transcription factor [Paracoccaceae bacterium]|nr:metalloregulator ArsR/SmtB family transcription factor [Paracoccaceae bacterium]
MANQNVTTLDTVFQALADPTRRAVISRLGRGPAPVKELASPHDMALPSFLKHLDMLERSGLVTSEKKGRVRVCTLHPEAFQIAETWIDKQRRVWEQRFDRLDALVAQTEKDEIDET